jgi:hypothetical protein
MRAFAGPSATVHFTHLSTTASTALDAHFTARTGSTLAAGKCHQIGVIDLMKEHNIPLERVCLLDPRAEQEISPEDGDGRFTWFLFGVSASPQHLNMFCTKDTVIRVYLVNMVYMVFYSCLMRTTRRRPSA